MCRSAASSRTRPSSSGRTACPSKWSPCSAARASCSSWCAPNSGIEKPADLKGKTITVMSYQDTTFYALLGLLASAGLTKDDVDIQSAGPVGVWQMVATGKSAGMAGVPDWIPPVEAAGVAIKVIPTDEFFPHMAQAIAASDQIIKDKPDMVRAFVKAALHGMKDIMDDPAAAAADFVKFVPEWTGKEGQVKEAFEYYDQAGLSGTEGTRRDRSRTPRQAAGLLSRQGHHPEEDAGRGALHQPVRAVTATSCRSCRCPASRSSKYRK